MLKLLVGAVEHYDEDREEFVQLDGSEIKLEHSLVSVAKWESKWEIPFLSVDEKTNEQVVDYINCMSIDQELDMALLNQITKKQFDQISYYIEAKMTATWVREENKKTFNREIITAEVLYYWMINYSIPFECQYWHLGRLLTLIKVCNAKAEAANNAGKKKPLTKDDLTRRRELNAQRKRDAQTQG